MSSLSEGWATTTLSEIASWGSGGTPSRSNPNYYGGGIPWIKTGELGQRFVLSTEETITEEGLSKSSAKVFPAGAVAIAMYGATIGKTSILGIDAATNQACAVGVPNAKLTSKEYLYHYLCSQKEAFVEAGKGGAQPNISQSVVKDWFVPLAPLNEQKRIADKLDAVLARVDACRDRLGRIPAILTRFRQSVLASATSGKLTEDWRGENGNEIDAWKTAKGAEVFSFITSGSRGWASYYANSGAIFLRIGNLDHETIELDLSEIQYVNPPEGAEGIRTRVQLNDILISITADVGMVGLVSEPIGDAYINQHICLARPKVDHSPKYLAYFLASPTGGLGRLQDLSRGATKVGLTLGDIRELEIKLPLLEEQTEIVRRVEALFACADRLEARYAAARAQVEKLTPATLAKAFRGELVPQDPNDEPASALLQRIKGQHSEQAGTNPKRSRKVAA